MAINRITSDIIEALSASKPKTQAYDTEAQVVRVEGNTAWVHIPGGVDETPVALTINASEGDTVRVRVAGGTAWIMGNDTAPPTDDKAAMVAIHNSMEAVNIAKETTIITDDLSQRIANANGLYETQQVTPGGATITYMHNKPNLSDSDVQIMISDVGVLVTSNGTDPNPTWYGLTVDGTLIASILQANGINADWINTGALVIYDNNNNEIFRADKTNKVFHWNMSRSSLSDDGEMVLIDNGDQAHPCFSVESSTANGGVTTVHASGFGSSRTGRSMGLNNTNLWYWQDTTRTWGEPAPSVWTIFSLEGSDTSSSLTINNKSLESWIDSRGKGDVTLSFSGSSTYFGTPSTWSVYVRKSVQTVQFQWNINVNVKSTTTDARVIATVPSGYRPYRDVFKVTEAQNGSRYILIVRTTGNVEIMNVSGAAFTAFMRDCITWVI